jgi:hypothetical protein
MGERYDLGCFVFIEINFSSVVAKRGVFYSPLIS